MSFEVYVQRLTGGEPATFARNEVIEIFGPRMAAHVPGERFIPLSYADEDAGILHIDATADIDHFTVMSPATEALFDDLLRLMARVGAVLYWPDEAPSLLVASETARADLPESMTEALGPGLLVRSGRDIIAAIKREF